MEESSAEEVCGEFGRVLEEVEAAEDGSRSYLWRPRRWRLSSVPFAVRVGFVMGAEMLETTLEREGATEMGEPGGTLS